MLCSFGVSVGRGGGRVDVVRVAGVAGASARVTVSEKEADVEEGVAGALEDVELDSVAL